jgi:hypothetical protein
MTQIQELTAIAKGLTFDPADQPAAASCRPQHYSISSGVQHVPRTRPDAPPISCTGLRGIRRISESPSRCGVAGSRNCHHQRRRGVRTANDIAALQHQKAAALVGLGGTANLTTAVLLLDRVINEMSTAASGSGSSRYSRHAAPEGDCIGADGWISQPRRRGSAV